MPPYKFYPGLAETYGIKEAIALGAFLNIDSLKSALYAPLDFLVVDNEMWVGFDEVDFEQLFPFWSHEECVVVMDSLVAKAVLLSREGRKTFYRLSPEFISQIKD